MCPQFIPTLETVADREIQAQQLLFSQQYNNYLFNEQGCGGGMQPK